MKRVTPGDVLAAYQKTNMKPRTRALFVNEALTGAPKYAGCGLGALCAAKLLANGTPLSRVGYQLTGNVQGPVTLLGLSSGYVQAFESAFDGESRVIDELDPDYVKQGYEDGCAAAKAVGLRP